MNLLPCPFCGCEIHVENIARDWHTLNGAHKETCIFYDVEMYKVPQLPEQLEMLVQDWNRRASPEPLTDEQMRECAQAMTAEPLTEGWPELIKFARAIEKAHGIGAGE